MVRIAKVKNVSIKSALKDLETLTDDEYKKLEKIVNENRDFSKTVPFGENSQVILAKIPDSKGPRKLEVKDGSDAWSIPVILPDGRWTNFVTRDAEEVKAFEAHLGCMVAIVGNLAERVVDGVTYVNIKPYRGSMIIEDPEVAEAVNKKKSNKGKKDLADELLDTAPPEDDLNV